MGCGASAAAKPTQDESSARPAPISDPHTGAAPVVKTPASPASSLSSPSRKSSVLKVRHDDVIPDDLSAFAGAIEAGHGADTTERFMRQSTGRVSQIRSSNARPRNSIRGDSRMTVKELHSLVEINEEDDWENEGEEEEEDDEEEEAEADSPTIIVRRRGSVLTRKVVDMQRAAESPRAFDTIAESPRLVETVGTPLISPAPLTPALIPGVAPALASSSVGVATTDVNAPAPAAPTDAAPTAAPAAAPTADAIPEGASEKETPMSASKETPLSVSTATPSTTNRSRRRSSNRKSSRRKSQMDCEVDEAKAFAAQAGAAFARMAKSAEMGHEIDGDEELPLPQAVCGTFSCGGMDEGKAKANQDCACVAYPMPADPHSALFLVLDGHGERGDVVSNELLTQLYERIGSAPWAAADADATTSARLVEGFEGAHKRLADFELDASGTPAGKESGAAAVAILLRAGRLAIAHCGDCRAVLGTLDDEPSGGGGSLVSLALTQDHKLEDEDEAPRILATGAWIRPSVEEPFFTPARIFKDEANPRAGPGLTMARSLGDMDADEVGIIPTPTVTFRELNRSRDQFIVLASDGVWEFLSTEHVVEVVGGFLERGEPAIVAARFLIAKAALAWRCEEGDYRDDITAIVLYIKDLPAPLLS